jgi:hypothetical protein
MCSARTPNTATETVALPGKERMKGEGDLLREARALPGK